MEIAPPRHVILHQTFNIGDMVLTFPLVRLIKQAYPACRVSILGRQYTQPIVAACPEVDGFLAWDTMQQHPLDQQIQHLQSEQADILIHVCRHKAIAQLGKLAGIAHRIGSNRKSAHWFTCNHLLNFSRRHSPLHESQINLKLLAPLGIHQALTLKQLAPLVHLTPQVALPQAIQAQLNTDKLKILLQPGTNGHGRKWPLAAFRALAQTIPTDRFQIYLTGSPKEAEQFKASFVDQCPNAIDLMGLPLAELITLISQMDGLIASSTGPLHLAAALGIYTLGLYPPRKGAWPKRWGPVGPNTQTLVSPNKRWACLTCSDQNGCPCMQSITAQQVIDHLTDTLCHNTGR